MHKNLCFVQKLWSSWKEIEVCMQACDVELKDTSSAAVPKSSRNNFSLLGQVKELEGKFAYKG